MVKGSNASPVVQKLPTLDGYTPRCWVISNTGNVVVVGYMEGMLQVSTSVLIVWGHVYGISRHSG